MIKFNCPHCQQSLRVPVSRADTEATCPGCHAQLRVPPAVVAEESEVLTAPPVVSQPPEMTAAPVVSEDSELVDLAEVVISESDLESDLGALEVPTDAEDNSASKGEECADSISSLSKENDAVKIQNYKFKYPSSLRVRYIKIIAKKLGNLPKWHLGYKHDGKSWLFVDEIQINNSI